MLIQILFVVIAMLPPKAHGIKFEFRINELSDCWVAGSMVVGQVAPMCRNNGTWDQLRTELKIYVREGKVATDTPLSLWHKTYLKPLY